MLENLTVASEASPQFPTRHPKNSCPRILVVDDNNDVRQLKLNLLTGSGYAVEGVNDGAYGWAALQVKHYDLIITDNTMPRIS
jgi:CheY-like chemotaxis protein